MRLATPRDFTKLSHEQQAERPGDNPPTGVKMVRLTNAIVQTMRTKAQASKAGESDDRDEVLGIGGAMSPEVIGEQWQGSPKRQGWQSAASRAGLGLDLQQARTWWLQCLQYEQQYQKNE